MNHMVTMIKYKGRAVANGPLRIPASGSRVRVFACKSRDGICAPHTNSSRSTPIPTTGQQGLYISPPETCNDERGQLCPHRLTPLAFLLLQPGVPGIKCPFHIVFKLSASTAICTYMSPGHSALCPFWIASHTTSIKRGPGFGAMVCCFFISSDFGIEYLRYSYLRLHWSKP